MSRTIAVEVTKEDIIDGVPLCSDQCALARALSRVLGDGLKVTYSNVEKVAWVYAQSTHYWLVNLPKACFQFAKDYDSGKPVHPFTFELTLP